MTTQWEAFGQSDLLPVLRDCINPIKKGEGQRACKGGMPAVEQPKEEEGGAVAVLAACRQCSVICTCHNPKK